MPFFGMFNIVLIGFGFAVLGFFLACLITLIIGCYQRKKQIIIPAVLAPLGVIALMFAADYAQEAQQAQNPFPYLTGVPQESLLPGSYVFDSGSFPYLEARGFKDVSCVLILRPDHTFKVTQMPHLWMDGSQENSGYDTCAGTWSIGTSSSATGYNVTLSLDLPPGTDKSRFEWGAAFLQVIAPKGERKDYALAVPIFNGDFDYVYMVRKRD